MRGGVAIGKSDEAGREHGAAGFVVLLRERELEVLDRREAKERNFGAVGFADVASGKEVQQVPLGGKLV